MPEAWPPLPYEAWKDTYATLHMWTQVVGKVALAKAPPLNHSWGTALQVTSRGLSTPALAHGARTFTMRFDFVSHELVIETSDGDARALPLVPRSVAAFYADTRATLHAMELPVRMWPMPVEIPDPVRFDQDEVHRAYDREAVERFWRILLQIHRVFLESRCGFVGKCSPVHFFWGSFDLAVTRFSGRRAPDRDGPAFMREAYSHEVISHGFWPGGPPVLEPAFYAYAVPTPSGRGRRGCPSRRGLLPPGAGRVRPPLRDDSTPATPRDCDPGIRGQHLPGRGRPRGLGSGRAGGVTFR